MMSKMYKTIGSASGGRLKLCAVLLPVLLLSGVVGTQAAPLPEQSGEVSQQSDRRTVRGTVKDSSGAPVIGASVLVVGTTSGTTTDLAGAYELSGPDGNFQIEVSFIGYKK